MAVQQPVSRQRRVAGIDSRLGQQVLGVEHLGHGEAVAESLVQCGQRVLHGGRGFESPGPELATRKVQGLHRGENG